MIRHALLWTALGALATRLDDLHAAAGITTYPDADWIGRVLPFSPVYAGAGLAGFLLYVGLVRPPRGGRLGGPPIPRRHAAASVLAFVAAYALTSLLGGAHAHAALPFACAALLGGWAAPVVRRQPPRVLAFLAVVSVAGPAFEWLAVRRGAFAYGVCPAPACLGTDVALVWLPLLYLHAGLLVHRLLSGRDTPRLGV